MEHDGGVIARHAAGNLLGLGDGGAAACDVIESVPGPMILGCLLKPKGSLAAFLIREVPQHGKGAYRPVPDAQRCDGDTGFYAPDIQQPGLTGCPGVKGQFREHLCCGAPQGIHPPDSQQPLSGLVNQVHLTVLVCADDALIQGVQDHLQLILHGEVIGRNSLQRVIHIRQGQGITGKFFAFQKESVPQLQGNLTDSIGSGEPGTQVHRLNTRRHQIYLAGGKSQLRLWHGFHFWGIGQQLDALEPNVIELGDALHGHVSVLIHQ